jgi:hypothetical protein
MTGLRKILRLVWETVWPYEIRWGIEQLAVSRYGPAQSPGFSKERVRSLTTSQTNPPAAKRRRCRETEALSGPLSFRGCPRSLVVHICCKRVCITRANQHQTRRVLTSPTAPEAEALIPRRVRDRAYFAKRFFITRPYLKRTLAHGAGSKHTLSSATFGKRCRLELGY